MICSRCCCRGCRFNGTRLDMSAKGQTEKNSVRANVFRVTPESGHCSMQSACLKGAGRRHRAHERGRRTILIFTKLHLSLRGAESLATWSASAADGADQRLADRRRASGARNRAVLQAFCRRRRRNPDLRGRRLASGRWLRSILEATPAGSSAPQCHRRSGRARVRSRRPAPARCCRVTSGATRASSAAPGAPYGDVVLLRRRSWRAARFLLPVARVRRRFDRQPVSRTTHGPQIAQPHERPRLLKLQSRRRYQWLPNLNSPKTTGMSRPSVVQETGRKAVPPMPQLKSKYWQQRCWYQN